MCHEGHGNGHQCTDDDNGKRPKVQNHSFMSERAEEVRSYMQSERIDEDDQSEGLGIFQSLRIDL